MEILDEDHGFALRAWQHMGAPEPPSRQQVNYLRQLGMNTYKDQFVSDETGMLTIHRKLKPWSVLSIRQIGSPLSE